MGAVGQPEVFQRQMEWRQRPEWQELEGLFERGGEEAILQRLKEQPDLAAVFHLPFLSTTAWAAGNGATNLLAWLLRDGLPSEEEGMYSTVDPLAAAAAGGWARCVGRLLDAGADPHRISPPFGGPLLHVLSGAAGQSLPGLHDIRMASPAERERALGLLLRAGANVFGTNFGGQTTLVFAASIPELTAFLFDSLITNAIPERQHSVNGDSLFHAAALLGTTQAMSVLASRGMPVTATNRLGWTPLHSLAATTARVSGGNPRLRAPEWSGLTCGVAMDPSNRVAVAQRLIELGAVHDLFTAAGLGDLAALKKRIATDTQARTARDSRGRTPIHWAALGDQPEAIHVLLDGGFDANAVDQDGNTPLHLAMLEWPSAAAKSLIRAGASLNITNVARRTPLGVAIYSAEAVEELLSAGAQPDVPGAVSPLALASAHSARFVRFSPGFVGMAMTPGGGGRPNPLAFTPWQGGRNVGRLLAAGARLDGTDENGRTPVEIACAVGALNLIETLVRAGGPLNATNAAGIPVWMTILPQGTTLPYEEPMSWRFRVFHQLPFAARQTIAQMGLAPAPPTIRPEPVLPFLARCGARLDFTNSAGETTLHLFAKMRFARGPNLGPAIIGPPTMTGPGVGFRRGAGGENQDLAGLKVLLDTGLKLEERDRAGNTPWLVAWRHLNLEAAQAFRELGANPKATNAAGHNALHLAMLPSPDSRPGSDRHPRFIGPLVGQLVQQGVDPKAKDREGRTPLHFAIAPFHPTFVAVELVEAGADPNVPDNQGMTPLALAERERRADLLRFFRDPVNAHPFGSPRPMGASRPGP